MLRVPWNFEIFHDRLGPGRWNWGNHIIAWNLVAWCSLPWSRSLYEMATLSLCSHFLISGGQGWCRSLNVLFSIDAICVSYIIISIFKFIFTLINLIAIISDINMWLWQWLKFIHVLSTMVIESMMGQLFILLFMMPTLLFGNHFMCVHHLC